MSHNAENRIRFPHVKDVIPTLGQWRSRHHVTSPTKRVSEYELVWRCHVDESVSKFSICAPVAVVGFAADDETLIRSMLKELGIVSLTFKSLTQVLKATANRTDKELNLIISMDAFDDLDSAIDQLLEFRKERMRAIVVLVSASVEVDDLGAERRAIVDVTLKSPVSMKRLQRGLIVARENKNPTDISTIK